jgi:hypothetical protein
LEKVVEVGVKSTGKEINRRRGGPVNVAEYQFFAMDKRFNRETLELFFKKG